MADADRPELDRGFGVVRATALNLNTVVGVGPFITIPLMLGAMGGPQAILGWLLGAVIAICDGMVWAELGAAWPGSGGAYHYLREAYGRDRWGRLMAFLFIWQFLLSGPLTVASGLIGFGQYCSYLKPGMSGREQTLIAAGVGVVAVVALYRKIGFIGKLTTALGIGTVLTMAGIIALGLPRFSLALAFSFPPNAFRFDAGFLAGLGSATLIAMYDYLGYAEVCFIGDEVREPARTIPRSIVYCVLGTAAAYLGMEIVIIGVLPWREAMKSSFVVADFMQRLHGRPAALVFTALVLWTAFASVFALLLGASRIPYAAARDGYFFSAFARIHSKKHIPHVSLFALGAVSIVAAFFDLADVISVSVVVSILLQFVAQIFALPLMRRRLRAQAPPFRMWLYPLPAVVALAGWLGIFAASGRRSIAWAVGTIALGVAAFLIHAKATGTWPLAAKQDAALG